VVLAAALVAARGVVVPEEPVIKEPETHPRVLDERELERFLRPQPPLPVPERVRPQPLPGFLAHTLLGNRVYKGPR
jgi:hypothetical protein